MANIRLYSTAGHSRIIEKLQTPGNYFKNGKNAMTITWLCTWVDYIIVVTDNPAIDNRETPKSPL